jgi:uncharacterized protein
VDTPARLRGLPWTDVHGVRVPVAVGILSRLLGLALLRRERSGPGLLIPDCRSVHTFGMRFQLDILFLDAEGGVVEVRRNVPPRRIARCPGAAGVAELPSP